MSRWARCGCRVSMSRMSETRAQHVAAGLAPVLAAVHDGEGQPAGVAEQHDDRHGKQPVDLARHVGQRGTGIPRAAQFDGEEQGGFEQAGCEGRVREQGLVAPHFRVRQLKEEFGLVPLGELGLLRMEGLAGGGFGQAAEGRGVGGAGDGQGAVAAIAERGEQRQAGGAQRGGGERGQCGGDVGEGVQGRHGEKGCGGRRLAAGSMTSGDPLPSPPPEGEGIGGGRKVRMAASRGCQRWGEAGRSWERERLVHLGVAARGEPRHARKRTGIRACPDRHDVRQHAPTRPPAEFGR